MNEATETEVGCLRTTTIYFEWGTNAAFMVHVLSFAKEGPDYNGENQYIATGKE